MAAGQHPLAVVKKPLPLKKKPRWKKKLLRRKKKQPPLKKKLLLKNQKRKLAECIEAGAIDFLQLVRLGLRGAEHPWIRDSLRVADELLRSDTPQGPVWHRYTGDGYGDA